jgi:hypothetical protein
MRLLMFHQKARLSAAATIDLPAKGADGAATYQLGLSDLEDRILQSASPAKN